MNHDIVSEIRAAANDKVREFLAGDSELGEDELATPESPGWHKPTDEIWTVNSEPALLMGGLASLMLQTLHPQVMAGVYDHSDYETDPLGRFQRTSRFVSATTFARAEIADGLVDQVNAIHKHITGTSEIGEPYKATDPHLLMWVHVTEVYCFWKSFVDYGPDVEVDVDAYVSQMGKTAIALGVPEPPQTWTEVEETLSAYQYECFYGKQAAETMKYLLDPRSAPGVASAPYAIAIPAALRLLPLWARKLAEIPLLPVVTPLAVKPVAKVLAGTLRWIALDRVAELRAGAAATGD